MSNSSTRRRARELVLQGLYERQVAASPPERIAADLAESHGYQRADPVYFDALWRGASADFDALMARVTPYLDRSVASLSPVERACLAIGAWELVNRLDIPYRVVINEAVDLAKSFGGTDGHKYVNGVLDRLAAEARAPEIAALARERGAAG